MTYIYQAGSLTGDDAEPLEDEHYPGNDEYEDVDHEDKDHTDAPETPSEEE